MRPLLKEIDPDAFAGEIARLVVCRYTEVAAALGMPAAPLPEAPELTPIAVEARRLAVLAKEGWAPKDEDDWSTERWVRGKLKEFSKILVGIREPELDVVDMALHGRESLRVNRHIHIDQIRVLASEPDLRTYDERLASFRSGKREESFGRDGVLAFLDGLGVPGVRYLLGTPVAR